MSKKKRAHAVREQSPPEKASPPPATEDSGELKEFVENYLTLADKALGFTRRSGPNNLTISTCVYCQHTIAATNLRLLAFAESLHACPARQP